MKVTRIILALGSNNLQENNIAGAQEQLRMLLPDIVFTRYMWTTPIGIVSDRFLNCMAKATTTLSLTQLRKEIKTIEQSLGNKDHSTGIVNIDIDLLQYGNRKFKENDWEREYVRLLISEII